MSLELDLAEFYLGFYATATVDDLKKELQELEKNLEESEEKVKKTACKYKCELNGFSTHSFITDNDILVVDWMTLHEKCICQDCELMMDNDSPDNPILLTHMIRQNIDIVNKAIVCKENKFDKLSDEELNNTCDETYKYSRYLDKCQTNFHWSDEETPVGLLKEMQENEKEINALEFEQKFRAIKKKYEMKTTLVQPDSD